MKIFSNKSKLINLIHKEKNLGFVPTMGSLHKGHKYLIKCSKKACKKTIVSIFINKPQFNKKNDYKKYPRNLNKDISLLKKLKVDFLYIPNHKQIYPNGPDKKIIISSFKKKLCGKFRPNHFEAIVDVVNRFIKIIRPKKIFFGEKDYQQFKIIEHFVKKNNIKTKVVGCKTVRENNGLACSSRNLLLTKKDIDIASKVYHFLIKNKKYLINKQTSLNIIKKELYKMGIKKIDYLSIIDTNKIVKPFIKKKNLKIFIAYYLSSTRLIDNF